MNHGHADFDPSQSCDGFQEYVDTDCANSGSETDFEAKRTHMLSNSEVIWDVAGNVWKWNKDNNSANANGGTSDYISQIAGIQSQFGPATLTCANPAANNRCGFGYLFDGLAGAVLRGGGWGSFANSGAFAVNLNFGPSFSNGDIGFRCVRRGF